MLLSWSSIQGPLLGLLLAAAPVLSHPGHHHEHVLPRAGAAEAASPFDMSAVALTKSRWTDNQDRTVTYLKWVDVERLLYVFRANHKLSTKGATANAGWDAPNFPFRSHAQGHFLSAWAQCYATLRDQTCHDRATYFVSELAKCQANNGAAGFATGYLSGFPESEFTALEGGKLTSGNVPYYVMHKMLAGLLDVWRHLGDTNARDVLLALAGWVDTRTAKLSTSQMQSVLNTEFGGMNEVLANLYQQTGDSRWLKTAQRFDHASVFDPLAQDRDQLNGLHANTNIPKWIGAAREYKATGTTRYHDIARNAWNITVSAHTYAIGANSQSEHFRAPNAIAAYLTKDTAEGCNTYNMLKLTRELFTLDPHSTTYFDFYERALINHMLGQQNPSDPHGHITYFTSLNAGGKRGLGPAWGGGTWSTDYSSFWCCQGTALETNTKLMDSIYFRDASNSTLYVNLFTPSTLNFAERGATLTQNTNFPVSDTTTLTINTASGSASWALAIRVPSWAASAAEININGAAVAGVSAAPGTYATIPARVWKAGDVVTVRLPMNLRTVWANDKVGSVGAVAFGPVVLYGDYGSSTVSSTPTLDLSTVKRTGSASATSGKDGLAFSATADGKAVKLGPYYEAQGMNYVVYWNVKNKLPGQ